MASNDDTFFQRLNRLFSSGTSLQKFVKQTSYNVDPKVAQSVQQTYRTYGKAFGAEAKNLPIGPRSDISVNRAGRYAVFETMDLTTPEISKSLDVYAEEIAGSDERGRNFHIYCEKPEVQKALFELFYEVMDIENNIRSWVRTLVKYGDFLLYHEVVPREGIVAFIPLPVNSINRIEGLDKEDPFAVKFTSTTQNKTYENWQITHFRILSNSLFYPYGTSILDSVRRTWEQLCLAEDSMLTYRVVRSPEKRQIQVEIGNAADKDIPSFMEAIKTRFRSLGHSDPTTGKIDYRFNPNAIEQDLFVPMRNGIPIIKIEPIPSNQNPTAVEDITYLQNKMLAGLGVPKAFLNYDENLSSKATLAQQDIRFSRTIAALQKDIISQLEKIAAIHLYAKGFMGEDLISFKFKFSNPSTVALQQKLSLWSSKADVITKFKDQGVTDIEWLQKNILELSDTEIAKIKRGQREDLLFANELKALAVEDGTKDSQVSDGLDTTGYNVPVDGVKPLEIQSNTEDNKLVNLVNKDNLIKPNNNNFTFNNKEKENNLPVKANRFIAKDKRNQRRRVQDHEGARNLSMPDFGKMLSPDNKYAKDVYGLKNEFNADAGLMETKENNINEYKYVIIKNEFTSCFSSFDKSKGIKRTIDGRILLSEDIEKEEQLKTTKEEQAVHSLTEFTE